ncbi:hypothetical protein QUF56_12135 [Ureibacillus composti]|nr:hypothetical protein [Ureibacillus composti]
MQEKSNLALLKEAELLFHQIIVLDLTMRTLEVDKAKLNVLKVSEPLVKLYEHQVKKMHEEMIEVKRALGKLGGKGNLTATNEGEIQVYSLLLRGTIHTYRYMSVVLKNHVENELLKRFGLPYRKNPYESDDGNKDEYRISEAEKEK